MPAPDRSVSSGVQGLTTEPTFDPAQGVWLSDGWPVPAPDATFDPDNQWRSASETAAAVGTCLQNKGWDVIVGRVEGGFEARVTPEQQTAYQDATKACHIELGVGTNPGRALDGRLAAEEFAAQERLLECLLNAGASPPALPSYQVYEEDLMMTGAAYNLYDGLPGKERYLESCPDPLDTWGFNG
ncbi:hypothetical protein AB1K54_16585 [Microbacterium sp. BWT-B31]|uniref:hypothetical protein n=1 Tax=Microbacterium sp. BWT-B31 TaxID=3232072 RepID=UPI003528B2C9